MNDVLTSLTLSNNNICQTKQCYKISENILNSIDFNINPCDDFYQYSCGSWLRKADLNSDKDEASQFSSVNKKHEKTITTLLQDITSYEDLIDKVKDKTMLPSTETEKKLDKHLFNIMKSYFKACMNITVINQLGATPLYSSLSTILKESNSNSSMGLTLLIISQLFEKEFPLFNIDTIPDSQQPHKNAIWIYKVTPLFFNNNNNNNNNNNKDLLYMNTTLRYQLEQDLYQLTLYVLSATTTTTITKKEKSKYKQLFDLSKDQIRKKVNHTIIFESLLSQIYHNISDTNIVSYNYTTFSEEFAIKKNNIIDWMKLINHLIGPITSSSSSSTNIYISNMDYFDALSTWIQQQRSNEVVKEIIYDYIFIRYIYQKIIYLDESLFQYRMSSSSSLPSSTSRLNHCVSLTSIELDQLVGRYFILYTQFNETKRNLILSFLKQMKTIWKNRLIQQQQNHHDKYRHQFQWLDDHTMTMMLEKLNKMNMETVYDIIYPDIRSPTSLNYFYNYNNNNNNGETISFHQISPDQFFQNNLILHQLQQSRIWFNFYKININGTILSSTLVDNQDIYPLFHPNAYYIPNYNKIIIPAGLITSPFFYFEEDENENENKDISSSIPTYINIGSLGMIIGHELTHAFDLDGRLYDGYGKKGNWWSTDVIDRFMEKVQCFIDQYSNMTVYDEQNNQTLFINGKLTLSENLADNGGLSVAYDTLKMIQELSSSESPESSLLLPNINLSPEQLFFVRFAQSFCSKLSSETLIQQVNTNNHSPTQVRINAVIQNSEVFASHFHCPTGSPMNPIKKCKLW